MLDALLTSVGCFCNSHRIGHVADKHHVLSPGPGSDRKIGVSRQEGFHLDEINADLLENIYRFATFLRIRSCNIPWPFETINKKTSHDNVGSKERTLFNCFTPETQLHIAS